MVLIFDIMFKMVLIFDIMFKMVLIFDITHPTTNRATTCTMLCFVNDLNGITKKDQIKHELRPKDHFKHEKDHSKHSIKMRTILNLLSKRESSATNTTKMRTKRY